MFCCYDLSRQVLCKWMFYCTLFLYCRVCNGPGVSRQTVWSLEIGAELLEPQSINNYNWFLIPTDHPQCVWLIQSYKLAVPSEIDLKLLLVREGAQNVLNGKGETRQWNLSIILDLLGECKLFVWLPCTSLKSHCWKNAKSVQGCLMWCLDKDMCRSVFKQENKPFSCIRYIILYYIVLYWGCIPNTSKLFVSSSSESHLQKIKERHAKPHVFHLLSITRPAATGGHFAAVVCQHTTVVSLFFCLFFIFLPK